MRKIPKEVDNPVDNFIDNYFIENIHELVNRLGITPNQISIIGLFFGLLSVYYFYLDKYTISATLWLISYYFDCLDGYIARTYNQVTKLGDFIDHSSDILKSLLMVIIMYRKDKYKLLKIILILSIPFMLMIAHLGCQQRLKTTTEEETLDAFSYFCPNTSYVKYYRYFGTGTVILIFSICILFWNKL